MADQFDAEAYRQEIMQRAEAAGEAARSEELETEVQKDVTTPGFNPQRSIEPVWGFTKKLPKNIGKATYLGLLATAETVDDIAGVVGGPPSPTMSEEQGLDTEKMQQLPQTAPAQTLFPEVFEAAHAFANDFNEDATTADFITQGIAQFAIPFTGWLKAIGGLKGVSTAQKVGRALTAEAAAVGTAFDPQEARVADVLAMGREMDNKFGQVLNMVAPDESAFNAYINMMTDRENEGKWEGRLKNVVDSLTVTGAAAGLIKAIPVTFRAARKIAEEVGTGPLPGSIRAQRGMVGFHGSPHEFDRFTLDNMGGGEGGQAFGFGLYFAQDEGVARGYRNRLSSNAFVFPGVASPLSKADLVERGFLNRGGASYLERDLIAADGDVDKAITLIQRRRDSGGQNAKEALGVLEQFRGDKIDIQSSGSLYEVDIPDETVGKMLDWDAELPDNIVKKVPEDLREAIEEELENFGMAGDITVLDGRHFHRALERIASEGELPGINPDVPFTGNPAQEVAAFLESIGVPGIKFFDGASRNATFSLQAAGDGYWVKRGTKNLKKFKTAEEARAFIESNEAKTRNIVVFNPESIKSVKRNGELVLSDELTDIERARALKNTEVEEIDGEHIVLEGDDLNTDAEIVPIDKDKK